MSNNEHIRTIEINGVKLEIDLRTAKRVDTFKVGDTVKLLRKHYGDEWQVCPAVIVAFTEFKNRPCIELLYVDNSGGVTFQAINQDTKDLEIAPASEHEFELSRGSIEARIQRDIDTKQAELETAQRRMILFNKFFGMEKEK